MRICILSDGYPPWEHGGAQKIAAQLAEGYAEHGHEVHVVTTVSNRDDVGRSVESGVQVHRLWTPRVHALLPYLTVRNPLVERSLPDLLVDIAPDIVHAHNVHYLSNASLRIADEFGLPVVKTFHDAGFVSYGELTTVAERAPPDLDPGDCLPASVYRVRPWQQAREQGLRYFPPRNALNRRCLARHVDVCVAVSEGLRRGLAANGIECHRVIRNGVDVATFDHGDKGDSDHDQGEDEEETEFRRRYGLQEDPFVLFGGRTSFEKGGAHLAAAFARVVEERGDVTDRLDDGSTGRLLVTGDDEYVETMRRIAGPAANRIVATGWISDSEVQTAFRSARVVVSPSVHLDPFPTVNLEAFAAGTPVVTSVFGGASELVDHGENGLIVDPRNVESLAAALRVFLTTPDRTAAFGTASRKKVRQKFSVDRQIKRYLELLKTVSHGKLST